MCYCEVRTLQTKSTMYKQCKQNSRDFVKKVLVIKLDPIKDFDKSTRLVLTYYTSFQLLRLLCTILFNTQSTSSISDDRWGSLGYSLNTLQNSLMYLNLRQHIFFQIIYILIKFLLCCYRGNALHAYFVIWRMLTAVKYWSFRHFGTRKFACNFFALKLACKL